MNENVNNQNKKRTDVVCIGFCCVDVCVRGMKEIDRSRELIPADNITIWGGGDAFNEACVLGKLGNSVKLMTGLGTDAAADMLRAIMEKANVDCSLSTITEEGTTSIAVPIVFHDAERGILSSGLSDSLNFYMNPDLLPRAKVVSLGSLYFPPLSDEKNTLEIVKKAKASGSIVCADMMWMDDGSCKLEKYDSVWPYIDYFFPNEQEAASLTGESDPRKMGERFLECGVKNVIIKIGKRGCLAMNGSRSLIVPPLLVDAKDTTGAGDNFAAGFITGLVENRSLQVCCMYANAAASISIQYDGASTGVQSKEQLMEVLKRYEEIKYEK